MSIKKIVGKIHLWLGFASGLVIVLLGITGCILAFEAEIRNATEPFRKVAEQRKAYLLPSQLKSIADQHLQFGKALGVEYPGRNKAAVAAYYDEDRYELLFMNPYTGKVLKYKNMNRDFFRIVLNGHFYLWLPHSIGRPIAASATLVFLLMLISGLILWWPKNKAARKQRFSVQWSAKWRRKNYDLHNVLGFYITWIAIFIAVTGLIFGFEWFAQSVYWVTSGGKTMVEHKHPLSDSTQPLNSINMADHLWKQHLTTLQPNESIGVYFASLRSDPVEVVVNHLPGTYYQSDYFHYDQYTGKELVTTGSYAGRFKDAGLADKIVRMNYDIHAGAILGITGKLLAFFASLVAASLPITGFYIWWGRKYKKTSSSEKTGLAIAVS